MFANTGNSGVRNLRAMFENKTGDQSTSPPSRGRSPSNSIISGNSRPVSKVRTSFVAVERPGDIGSAPQWGLRKASDVSSMAEAKGNEDAIDMSRTTTIENKPEQTKSPTSPHMSKDSIDGGLGTILKGSSFDGTPKKTQQEKPLDSQAPTATVKKDSTTSGVGSKAAEMIKKMQSNEKPGPLSATKIITDSDPKPLKNPHPKSMVKHSPISPKPSKLERSSPKTPTSPASVKSLVRGGPAKVKGVMESAKRASEARETAKKEPSNPIPKEAETRVQEPKSATKETKTQAHVPLKADPKKETEVLAKHPPKVATKKETETQPRPKINGIKKETVTSPTSTTSPRSPTKPMKLPSVATATTAAAAAKHDSHPPTQPPARKPAPRASLPATQSRATAPTTTSALHKRPSRASLATDTSERPKSRVSMGKPDESFLARMMRPTQSSAQKTHEKVQTNSPPRAQHPSTTKIASTKTKAAGIKSFRKSDQSEDQFGKLENVAEAPTIEDTGEAEPDSAIDAANETLSPVNDTSAPAQEQNTNILVNGSSTEAQKATAVA